MSDIGGATTAATLPIPGWYADPLTPGGFRWWSGFEWTEHARGTDAVIAPIDHLPGPPPILDPVPPVAPWASHIGSVAASSGYAPMASGGLAALSLPPRRGYGNTLGIWLLALFPLMQVAMLLTGTALIFSIVGPAGASLALGVIFMAESILWFGMFVGFVILDRSALERSGLAAPSLFWVLLPPIVYIAMQRLTLKRQGIRRDAPSNVFVLAGVASIIMAGLLGPLLQQGTMEVGLPALEAQLQGQLESSSSMIWDVQCPPHLTSTEVGSRFECRASSDRGSQLQIEIVIDSAWKFVVESATDATVATTS